MPFSCYDDVDCDIGVVELHSVSGAFIASNVDEIVVTFRKFGVIKDYRIPSTFSVHYRTESINQVLPRMLCTEADATKGTQSKLGLEMTVKELRMDRSCWQFERAKFRSIFVGMQSAGS